MLGVRHLLGLAVDRCGGAENELTDFPAAHRLDQIPDADSVLRPERGRSLHALTDLDHGGEIDDGGYPRLVLLLLNTFNRQAKAGWSPPRLLPCPAWCFQAKEIHWLPFAQ